MITWRLCGIVISIAFWWHQGARASAEEIKAQGLSNPLWAIPLTKLSATRDRPLFSPTRRPPPLIARPATVAPMVTPPQPDRPQFSLVGTAISANDSFGLFLENINKQVFRLKIGDAHSGWTLRSLQQRSASLEKSGSVVAVELPAHTLPGGSLAAIAAGHPIALVKD